MEPAPRRPELREGVRLRPTDPPRPLHVRLRCASRPKAFSNNDPRFFKSIKVRFQRVRLPGRDPDDRDVEGRGEDRLPLQGEGARQGRHLERGGGALEIRRRRRRRRRPRRRRPPARRASGEPTSAEAFAVIADRIGSNSGIVGEVGKTFLFKLTGRTRRGRSISRTARAASPLAAAPATASSSSATRISAAMTAGKVDPMKLWTDKKLKISGDVMASQKLIS